MISLRKLFLNGGKGSGDFGHEGRPGQVGGSSSNDLQREKRIKDIAYRFDALDRQTVGDIVPLNELKVGEKMWISGKSVNPYKLVKKGELQEVDRFTGMEIGMPIRVRTKNERTIFFGSDYIYGREVIENDAINKELIELQKENAFLRKQRYG